MRRFLFGAAGARGPGAPTEAQRKGARVVAGVQRCT